MSVGSPIRAPGSLGSFVVLIVPAAPLVLLALVLTVSLLLLGRRRIITERRLRRRGLIRRFGRGRAVIGHI
jgi:hypothetical protein